MSCAVARMPEIMGESPSTVDVARNEPAWPTYRALAKSIRASSPKRRATRSHNRLLTFRNTRVLHYEEFGSGGERSPPE